MKKIFLLLTIAVLSGCTTERIYLIMLPKEDTKSVVITDAASRINNLENTFSKSFHKSESLFRMIEKASDEAMKNALKKTFLR